MQTGRLKNKHPDQNPSFLTLGGNPVLDFCNTLLIHSDRREDRLLTSKDAESFLKFFFQQKLSLTKKQFTLLLHLRFCFREYFYSLIEKKSNTNKRSHLTEFLESLKLVIEWHATNNNFSKLSVSDKKRKYLESMISEFFEFNRRFDGERIRKCANKNCSHLFYDVSKRNTRIWCTMKSCGNLHKARRFQARSKNNSTRTD
jgi:predicted RNA-binding Zn ribbon-like protein